MDRHSGVVGLLLVVSIADVCGAEHGGLAQSLFADMMLLRDSASARASSYDRSGGNDDSRAIPPGQTLELADIPGAGCIRHIYFTGLGGPHYLRDMVLRMYWDGEDNPSVEVPFGDFFGL